MQEEKKISRSGVLFCTIVAIPLNGWVLSHLWNWFIFPVFDLPFLSVADSIGLSMVTRFITSSTRSSKVDNTDMIAHCILYPFIMIGLGYLLNAILF